MDFNLDDEQTALRNAVGSLLKGYDAQTRRNVTASDPGYDEETWRQMAGMGLLGLPFSSEDGGAGAGPAEMGLVAEEVGRVLAPEPYVATVALAGGMVAGAGSAEQRAELLGSLSAGERMLAFAEVDDPSSPEGGVA